jgi:DUF1009 family protein
MITINASVLAIEAERTVVLDREEMLAHAQSAGIAIVGISTANSMIQAASTQDG